MTALRALELVLPHSGLAVRKTGGRLSSVPGGEDDPGQLLAMPEILVIGRRTQNTDIRQTKNDVRPYLVVTRCKIARLHVSKGDQALDECIPRIDPVRIP